MQKVKLTANKNKYIILKEITNQKGAAFMEFLPGAVQVLIEWLILIFTTIGGYFNKLNADE